MRLGLHALGIGAGAQRAVIDTVAAAAETAGFDTLWAGEHVVMVDQSSSRYPYSADGQIAVSSTVDWLDPMVCLSFAAAATSTIGVATGVLLLPEHNPVVVAKQAATLDQLSDGRLTLGVGIGWSRDEFDALGVPFARRGSRTREYVAAMRAIWRADVASFQGEFVRFDRIRVNPKPFREGESPSSSAATATRRSGGSRPGATAGTGSTSRTSPRSPSGSRSCATVAERSVATRPSCSCRGDAESAAEGRGATRRPEDRRAGDRRSAAGRPPAGRRLGRLPGRVLAAVGIPGLTAR